MGLGPCVRTSAAAIGRSLTAVRERAFGARSLLLSGIDPIDQRESLRTTAKEADLAKKVEAQRDRLTLARAARAYHERVVEPTRSSLHSAHWIASLENNLPERIWQKPMDQITAPELLDVMAAMKLRVPETAQRVLQRLGVVFDDCMFRATCNANPAHAIRKKLAETKRGKERRQLAALPYKEAPAFMAALRAREGIAARAFEFAVLTASRTGEVIGATWPEIDLKNALWVVPGSRMKGREEHRVPLSPGALAIAQSLLPLGEAYVFPNSAQTGRPLSNMAMLTLLRRMDADKRTTVHGLARSTFSTWANELGIARPDVIEACLAHREGDRIRAAYNRAKFSKERAALLTAWASYLAGEDAARNVIEFPQHRSAA